MTKLVTVGVVELVALLVLWRAVRVRKRKILKWIVGILAVLLQIAFWYLALKYQTAFLIAEISINVTVILFHINQIVSALKKEAKKTETKKTLDFIVLIEFGLLVVNILGIVYGIGKFCTLKKWDDEVVVEVTQEPANVPKEIAQEFDIEFECIHDSNEREYDLYCTWEDGIYKIATYKEQVCKVYKLSEKGKKDFPMIEKKIESKSKYDYNFEKYEPPTLLETSEEVSYIIYVSKESYKEDYSEIE